MISGLNLPLTPEWAWESPLSRPGLESDTAWPPPRVTFAVAPLEEVPVLSPRPAVIAAPLLIPEPRATNATPSGPSSKHSLAARPSLFSGSWILEGGVVSWTPSLQSGAQE